MNILVTGCAGFIGSNLTEKLLSDNNVIGVDNFDKIYSESIKIQNMVSFKDSKNFKFYKLDIRDKIDKLFKENKIDVVVHLAAKPGVRASFENPKEYISVNVDGTVNLLKNMKKYGVNKFIFASSSSVYGNCENFREDNSDLKPLSPYAQAKKTAEELIKSYSDDISALCLRFFTVYGPKQRPDLVIHKFTKLILQNKPIHMYGDGTSYRDYTYVDDIVDGIVAAINYNKTKFEIINLGAGHPIKLCDMIEYLEKELNKKASIIQEPPAKGDVKGTFADISKAKSILGYNPKVSFQEGLHKFINSMPIAG